VSEIAPSGLVPPDRDDVELLLNLFTLEKGLYEIRYELAHRPQWVGWPLAAVGEMLAPVTVR
jgi:predicted trehalose synthase